MLAAFAVRLILVLIVFRDQTDPTDNHAQFGWEMGWVARSIALGHGFGSPFAPFTGPTAIVPPLFPWLLAAVFRLFGLYTAAAAFAILSINSLLSALTCIPIWFSAKYAFNERIARFAIVGWAIYPYSIYFSAARVWDYALTALLFATCFYFAQRLHTRKRLLVWLGFGLLYGLNILANPSVLPLFPILLGIAAWQRRAIGGRWLPHSILAAAGAVAVLLPWVVHNDRVLGVVRPVRDNFWMECWAGNNGDTFESNAKWAHPASSPPEMKRFLQLGEIPYLAEKQALATAFIRNHPGFFAMLSLRRALCFWTGYWSFNPTYLQQEPLQNADIFFCTGMTAFMFLGMAAFWRESRRRAWPWLLLIALFPLTYYVTHASPDYREPIEPQIVILAVIGLAALHNRLRPEPQPVAIEVEVEEEARRLTV